MHPIPLSGAVTADTAIPYVSVWKSPVSSIAIGSNSLGDMAGNKETHQVTRQCLNSEHAGPGRPDTVEKAPGPPPSPKARAATSAGPLRPSS